MRMSRRSMAVVGVAAGLSAVGAVAAASIPEASNTIHACYLNTGGNLRVIDSAAPGAACDGAGETALAWNQSGPQGPAGPKGDTGPAGAAGAKGDPGAGVIAYRTIPDQKGVFVDEPGNDHGQDHVDTKLDLPAGVYSIAAHWFVSSPSALCFLLLRDGSTPLSGSIYGQLSDPATVQYESTFGVPETARYGITVEHGQASVVGSIPAGGYALVRCQGSNGRSAHRHHAAARGDHGAARVLRGRRGRERRHDRARPVAEGRHRQGAAQGHDADLGRHAVAAAQDRLRRREGADPAAARPDRAAVEQRGLRAGDCGDGRHLRHAGAQGGQRVREGRAVGDRAETYCGSTSTLNATPRCSRAAASASTAAPIAATARARSAAFTTTWLRCLPRRRNSGAGPSTLATSAGSAASRRARSAPAAASGAPSSSRAQTTRTSVANGG